MDSDIKPSNGIKINSSVHSLFLLTSDDFIPDDEPESKVDSEYKLFLLNRDKFRNNVKLNELILDYSSYPTTIGDWEGNLCTNGYYSNHIGMIDEEQLKKTLSYDMAQSFIGRYECNFSGAGYIGNFSVRTDLSYHCKISGKETGDGQCNGEAISTIYADIDHETKGVEIEIYFQEWFNFCGTVTEDGEFISGNFGEDFGCREPLGTFSCNIVSQ